MTVNRSSTHRVVVKGASTDRAPGCSASFLYGGDRHNGGEYGHFPDMECVLRSTCGRWLQPAAARIWCSNSRGAKLQARGLSETPTGSLRCCAPGCSLAALGWHLAAWPRTTQTPQRPLSVSNSSSLDIHCG